MFRDESSHVIKKVRARAERRPVDVRGTSPEPKSRPAPPSASGPPSKLRHARDLSPRFRAADASSWSARRLRESKDPPPLPTTAGWQKPPMYTLSPTYHERGTAYFFSRFVSIDEKACHQRFDFIYDVWKPASKIGIDPLVDSVAASMTAVGLAGLANMTRSWEIMVSARKSYGAALRLINTALRTPDEAVKDTTMLSILILGLFEMIVDPDARTFRGTVKAWHEHVNGAAALAKLRGVAQFRTRAGIKMFMMLCQTVTLSCIQQGIPMPQSVLDLRAELSRLLKSLNSPESRIEVSMPIYRVLQFRHEVQSGRLGTPEAIIDRLIEMDNEFVQVIANLPTSYRYRILHVPEPHKDVFDGTCHVYPTMVKAAIWNGFRSCRLLILETILTEIYNRFRDVDPADVPPRYGRAFGAARATLPRLCHAILASVPQHAGLLANSSYRSTVGLVSTVEVCPAAPTLHTPELTSSSNPKSTWTSSSHRDIGATAKESVLDDSGPTLFDPTRTQDPDEETHRLMLLASAGNTIVWPLYHVGMSSVCSPPMKTYCVERLEAIYRESGLRQAKAIATIMQTRYVLPRWMELRYVKGPESLEVV